MSYTEHDETMDSHNLDGITASDAAESSPVGVSQEAPGMEKADPAGGRTGSIAPVPEAGTKEGVTIPATQAKGGGLDPPETPLPSGESEQTGEAGPETPVEEKPRRKRVSRKKAADPPEDTSSGGAAGEAARTSEEEDAFSGVSNDLSAQGGDTPEYDDDENLETDAPVLGNGGEKMPPTSLEGTGDNDTADAPMEGPEPAPSPKAWSARCTASATKTANRPKREFTGKPLKDKLTLLSLDLNKLDEGPSEEERNEWSAVYASYRSKSILTGRIMGIDAHSFIVRNREIRQAERRKMLCAVIISYRVKVSIPKTEVWYPGQGRPLYVLHNMSGTETDYIILDIDRGSGVAIGPRRMALAAQRHFFNTIREGRSIGEKLTYRALTMGPRRCLVGYGGRDMSLNQKGLTYIVTSDLRTRYHPGQTLNCILKEYDRRGGQFWVSAKGTVDNPFLGALRRHPIGSRRQAVISGRYGGGVFCTLSDETVCLCHYFTLYSNLDFHVGSTVTLAIKQFDYERSLIYDRIPSKW